jgi:putative IMPACT (imprinted ancient) family translation regulator
VREQAPQLDLGQFADDPAVEGESIGRERVADDGDERGLTHVPMVNAIRQRRNAKTTDFGP